jgi:thiol-disulfide isomerase/thioredoxin
MWKFLFLFLFVTFSGVSQNVPVIKVTDLEKRVKNNSDTTYIVNFWATWCAPCVKELPDFDSINAVYKTQKVKVLLVSMDFKEDLSSKLVPFITTKKIQSEVVLLDELNGNYFIPKVSNDWSGAIPATWILNGKKKTEHFFEKKVDFNFLRNEIELINKN